ncbi:MAG: 2-amino-3,7-dideoxy-D-threo-hept-6-ulosonate synthase [Syntrophobacteraceae bacterium]
MSGKILRLKRIVSPADGRAVIFPMDHGVTCGPMPGLERIDKTIDAGVRAGADAFILHKGMLRYLEPVAAPLPGIIMHLSASTCMGPSVFYKVPVGGVEEAVRRGADGVSVHINLGARREPDMLKDLGEIARSCSEWQMPLLVMAYSVREGKQSTRGPDVAHAARLAAELGADVIKIPFPEDYDVLAAITSSVPVPVVIAGGSPPGAIINLLKRIEKSLQAGACGVAVGRCVFQHSNPGAVLAAIRDIVHNGVPAAEFSDL